MGLFALLVVALAVVGVIWFRPALAAASDDSMGMSGGCTSLAASGEYVYVLVDDVLYQYQARDLSLRKQVRVEGLTAHPSNSDSGSMSY